MKWRNRKESVTLVTKWNHQDHLKLLFSFCYQSALHVSKTSKWNKKNWSSRLIKRLKIKSVANEFSAAFRILSFQGRFLYNKRGTRNRTDKRKIPNTKWARENSSEEWEERKLSGKFFMQPGHFLKSPSYFSGPELNIQIKIWSQLFKRGVSLSTG